MIVLLALSSITVFLCDSQICVLNRSMATANIQISKPTIHYYNISVYIAATTHEQEIGYMHTDTLGNNCSLNNITNFDACNPKGMLFVFKNQTPLCFWMHNTTIPLEQAWIASNGTVLFVYYATPYSNISVCQSGQYVLETNGTYMPIQKGDIINLSHVG